MRSLPSLLLVLAAACSSRVPSAPEPADGAVRCGLVSLKKTTDAEWSASFVVENGSASAFTFRGFAPDSPLYEGEVLEGSEWKPMQLGWCGTGLSAQVLEPGARMQFSVVVPGDGKTYRFRLGEPPVVTPTILAEKL